MVKKEGCQSIRNNWGQWVISDRRGILYFVHFHVLQGRGLLNLGTDAQNSVAYITQSPLNKTAILSC